MSLDVSIVLAETERGLLKPTVTSEAIAKLSSVSAKTRESSQDQYHVGLTI